MSDIINLEYEKNNENVSVQANTSIFFKVKINRDDEKLYIKITAATKHSNFTIDLAFFSYGVTDDELRNISNNYKNNFNRTIFSDGDNETTLIEIKNKNKSSFLGIHLLNEYTTYIDIMIKPNNNNSNNNKDNSFPIWIIILILIFVVIIIIMIIGSICHEKLTNCCPDC